METREHEEWLKPFVAAVSVVLEEMAQADVSVANVRAFRGILPFATPIALVPLESSSVSAIVLSIPPNAAESIARRVLAESQHAIDTAIVQDFVCELANVIAGQAKAMLAGGRYRITFGLPQSHVDERWTVERNWLIATLASDWGEFTLNLCLAKLDDT